MQVKLEEVRFNYAVSIPGLADTFFNIYKHGARRQGSKDHRPIVLTAVDIGVCVSVPGKRDAIIPYGTVKYMIPLDEVDFAAGDHHKGLEEQEKIFRARKAARPKDRTK